MATPPIQIEIIGLDKAITEINKRTKAVEAALMKGARSGLDYIHETMPPYPPAKKGKYPWKTQKQRFFVMMSIREGSIRLPYRRTGLLGKKWTAAVKTIGSDIVGTLGTDLDHAPWVISSDVVSPSSKGPQSQYHSGTWWLIQTHIISKTKPIIEIIKKTINRAFLSAK